MTSTSSLRYEGKMFQLLLARFGSHVELAREVARCMNIEREAGYRIYGDLYRVLRVYLKEAGVDYAFWGIARSALFEFINKVFIRRILTLDDWRKKWSKLPPEVLGALEKLIEKHIIARSETPKRSNKDGN